MFGTGFAFNIAKQGKHEINILIIHGYQFIARIENNT